VIGILRVLHLRAIRPANLDAGADDAIRDVDMGG
jgi:hypothetical protein